MPVNIHLTHYRWGNDDGSTEANYTFAAAQDANLPTVAGDSIWLLCVGMQETGATLASNHDFQLQRVLNGGAFGDISIASSIVKAVACSSFVDAASPTQRLTGMTGTFESSSQTCSEDGLAGGAQCDIAASGNAECVFAIQILDTGTNPGDVVTFQITSPDSTITNDVVPTATVANPIAVTPTTKVLTITRFAPTVAAAASIVVTPPTKALTITTFAPTVATPIVVTPGLKALLITAFAPTVSVSASVLVTPATKALTIATFEPTVAAGSTGGGLGSGIGPSILIGR